MRSRRLRRISVLIGAAIVAAASLIVVAPGAHAAEPFPSGATNFEINGTFSFTVSGSAAPINFTASMSGTADSNGNIAFPQGSINFPTVQVTLLGQAATVHISPTGSWASTINTSTGVVTLSGGFTTLIDIPPSNLACGLGPITLQSSSTVSGGKAYQSGSPAHATVVDRTFAVPAATNPNGTCAISALITAALGAPIPQGQVNPARFVLANLTINHGAPPATTTTTIGHGTPIIINTPSVQAGSQLTIVGGGWKAGSTVQIILASTPVGIGSATVGSNGTFVATVTIPADTTPGTHSIVLVGTSNTGVARQVSRTITVTAAPAEGSGGSANELPRTGSSSGPGALFGATMLLAGLALVLSARRRFVRD